MLKTIILPTLHTNIPNTKLEEMLYLLAIARYKENIHITFLENVISNNMYNYIHDMISWDEVHMYIYIYIYIYTPSLVLHAREE